MAKDIRVIPELVEARRLALAHNVLPITHSFVSDLETPVSAFLKLGAPRRAFLLESAEQGQHLGRFSFLGVGARALVTYADGRLTVQENGDRLSVEHDDPFTAVADLMRSYRPPASGEAAALPPLAGGLVGYFGYDLVRRLEPLPDAPPDDLGLPEMAFLLADTVLVFDHLKHTITIVANAFVDGRDVDGPYERAVERIADVRAKLAAPLPAGAAGRMVDARRGRRGPGAASARPRHLVDDPRAVRGRRGAHPRVHLRRRRLPGRARPALQHAGRRLAVLHLPRRPRREPEPVPVLHRLRRLRPLRLEPRAAGHRPGRPRRDAADRRHPPAGREPRRGPAPHRGPARRREGARRARHARRPRPQRPRPRLRPRHRQGRRVHGDGALLARHPHGLVGERHAGGGQRPDRRAQGRASPPAP